MADGHKTREQLEAELAELRRRVAELESLPDGRRADFRQLVDRAPDILFRWSVENGLEYVSPIVSEITGYTAEELTSDPLLGFKIAVGEEPQLEAEYEWVLSEGAAPRAREFRYVRKDGTVSYLDIRSTALRDDKGKIVAFEGVLRDITQRKQAEEALRESEGKYRSLVERATDGILIIQDGVVEYANPRLAEMAGTSLKEIIGAPFADYVYPDERSKVIERYRQRLSGKQIEPIYETVLRRADGTALSAEINAGLISYRGRPADLVFVRDITRRKRVEEALRLEKAYLEQLFESAPEAIVLVDNDSRILRVNSEFTRTFGYAVDEVLGRSIDDLLAPEGLQEEAVSITRRVARGERVTFETIRQRRDGSLVYVSILGAPIKVDGGQVAVYGIYRDITDRKRAEEALRRRAEELGALQATVLAITAPDDLPSLLETIVERAARLLNAQAGGMYLCDPDRREARCVVSYNTRRDYRGVVLKYGEGAAGLVAQSGEPLIIDDYRIWPRRAAAFEEEQPFAAVLSAPMIWQDEVIGVIDLLQDGDQDRFTRADLELLTLFANHAAIAVENARLYERGQAELAERRRIEDALRRYAGRLEVLREIDQAILAAQSPEEIAKATLTRIRQLVRCQRASVAVFDLSTGEATVLAVHADRETRAGPGTVFSIEGFEATEKLLQGKVHVTQDLASVPQPSTFSQILLQEGVHSYISVPLLTQGQLIGTLNLAATASGAFSREEVDVAREVAIPLAVAIQHARLYEEVRRHADEVAEALVRLQELDHLKNEFIQNVSHELRSPLALIRGYAELLDSGDLGELESEQQGPVEIIARRTRMLADLVEDITLILAAEARPMLREPVALDELTHTAVEDFRLPADQAGLTVNEDIAPGLPPVAGESIYVRRVLDNLLANAVKFTPAGGTITVRVLQEQEWILLQISDSGIGIAGDLQGRIFERFYQVDGSSRRRYGGAGLGLALVKEVVEALGGRVSVHSETGSGSTFTVALPVYGRQE
jgi:PAS domain S-box-containing protein